MADNIVLSAAVGAGATAASDDIAGVHHQRVKISLGADGIAADALGGAGLDAAGVQRVSLASDVALPAGTNAIGKLAANAGVTIGAVEIAAAQTLATVTTVSTITNVVHIDDNASTISIDDGAGSITVDGTVTATIAAGATTIAKAEDVASADADVGVPAMAVRKATPANTSGLDGDYEFLQMSAGRLWASTTIDAALPAGDNNIGNVDVVTVPVDPFGVNADAASATGSISAKLKFIAGTGIPITGTVTVGAHAVTNAGTFAVQAAGDVAHDGVDSGSPTKVGGMARTTNPTAVANADRTNFIADKLGKQVVVSAIRDLKAIQTTTITASAAETTIVTAVASTFVDLYGLIVANSSATAATITIKDATAGTTRMTLYVPAGDTRGFMLDPGAAIPQAAVNNNWTATCTSVTSLFITALTVQNL